MLQLINVSKKHLQQIILDNINLTFSKNEKVMIVGPSGSGKTTLLNLIFKLDNPNSGNIYYKGLDLNKINDNYYHIQMGYVLQTYELLEELSVIENIKLASIISRKKAFADIFAILKIVDLEKKANQQVKTLSGGEKQRVAIARALINNPDIIIADEPTGSLDTASSKEIMELLSKLSQDKLLIMVTHNESLANKYGTRIIRIKDGKIESDSNKKIINNNEIIKNQKKRTIKILDIIKISIKNVIKEKKKFILTSLATSLGILGLTLVLLISEAVKKELTNIERNKISSFPIVIQNGYQKTKNNSNYTFPNSDSYEPKKENKTFYLDNNIINYLRDIDQELISASSERLLSNYIVMNNNYDFIDNSNLISLPTIDINNQFLKINFDLLTGSFPKNKSELVLIIDGNNQISKSLYDQIGKKSIGKELKLINNNAFFIKKNNSYKVNDNLKLTYNHNDNIELKIVGIIRPKLDNSLYHEISGIGISENIIKDLIEINKNSKIITEQIHANHNLLTGIKKDDNTLLELFYNEMPLEISLFPKDYLSRMKTIEYLNNYSKEIIYQDLSEEFISTTKEVFRTITIALLLFSIIAIIVIIFMIGILNYIKTLERSKEIGIYRILGASKKDIILILNNENVIIGIVSALISLTLANLIVGYLFSSLLGISQNNFNYKVGVLVLLIGVITCSIGGLLPIVKKVKEPIINNIK